MKSTRNTGSHLGFTLIELMIVVAIIGILAAVAIPKFADLINKSKEGSTKGSLGAMRSAVSVYYGDMEGLYPADNLTTLTQNSGKYIASIPLAKIPPYHGDVSGVATSAGPAATDAAGWAYDNTGATSSTYGTILVNCSHTDTKSNRWTSY
ncbi:MAG: prepilin-type N-terminal cleavage/methylation domain-containing protein [Elusimicrobia bacterium]|nr:prepilin-type N-terminal cleavage/methylation domain-containing protein [Elusimicrobiota bacterium]